MKHKMIAALLLGFVAAAVCGTRASAQDGLESIKAAVNWGNGKVYFFGLHNRLGFVYVSYDIKKDRADPGYPKEVNDKTWPGLGKLDDITAAVNWGNGKVYFFGYVDDSGTEYYLRYDIRAGRADSGYPKPVTNKVWPGLLKLKSIRTGINWGNGYVYFIGHGENEKPVYLSYDIAKDRAKESRPVPVNNKTWPGLTLKYIIAGVDWGNGKVYIFGYMDDFDTTYYVRYDKKTNRVEKGYPKRVTKGLWPGLLKEK